jgi:hypothetical protein
MDQTLAILPLLVPSINIDLLVSSKTPMNMPYSTALSVRKEKN